MKYVWTSLALALAPLAATAEAYNRPIPQAQSATAEVWFFVASLSMVAALFAVNWLIRRK